MKQNINLGTYGWRHSHWLNTFYPEDLPVSGAEDWQLTYFSNEFNAVLVPAGYWLTGESIDCETWLDAVHEGFQFFVECHVSMLEFISMAELSANLKKLQPQLVGLIFLDEKQQMSAAVKNQFEVLANSLIVESPQKNIWRIDKPCTSNFAFIENDLSDLRLAKNITENFASQLENESATIIVHHAQLQASDLSKFRLTLEIMGY